MHYHLHSETGACYGDSESFEVAARNAAEHTYPWCVDDATPLDDILTVIESSFCIAVCREETC